MNTGFAEFSEESSEEPYSRALTDSSISSPAGCACVALRKLPLQCDLQSLVGPVSQSSCALCGLSLSALSAPSSTLSPALLQALAPCIDLAENACSPRTTPIDGIRPTATPTCTVESPSSGRPNCSLHRHSFCREDATGNEQQLPLVNELLITHCASPEHASLGLSKSTALLSTKYLARFSTIAASKQTTTTTTNERTLANRQLDYFRPANVATFIELPTLRPLQCCY